MGRGLQTLDFTKKGGPYVFLEEKRHQPLANISEI